MARKKKKKAPKQAREEGRMFGLRAWIGDLASRLWVAGRVVTALCGVGLVVAWIIGLGPLRQSVSAARMDLVQVSIEWPVGEEPNRSWLFPEVREELLQIVTATVSPDPFDHDSLVAAAKKLQATGWFRDDLLVRRDSGGIVNVTGSWRTPAAVVSMQGREWLVDMDGAALRLPPSARAPARFLRIYDPAMPAPRDGSGNVRYGVRWDTDDVRDAIELLWKIVSEAEPASRALVGVDLGEFGRTGRLVLVTDSGCRIVWGGPLSESRPGEAPVDHRLGQLAQILRPEARQDRGVSRIDLYTGYALVSPGGENTNATGSTGRDNRRRPAP